MYYNLKLAWEPKIIGVRNGIYQVELDKSAYENSLYKQIEMNFISNEFTLKAVDGNFVFYFKKLKTAKMTSFISFCPNLKHCHFLVHKRIYEVFNNFNIQNFKKFDAVLLDKSGTELDTDYKLFFCILQDWDVIDFEQTVFESGGFGNNPKIEHQFLDENEFKAFNGIASVKTLALNSSFDIALDLFITRLGGMFVSERLKLALEEVGATGIRFENSVKVVCSCA